MNCGRVSNQLSAYLDRELTGAEMLQIRGHLSACDSCRTEYEALSRMKMMLGRLRTPEPGPGFVAATSSRFEQLHSVRALEGRPTLLGLFKMWGHKSGDLQSQLSRLAEPVGALLDRLGAAISSLQSAAVREAAPGAVWPRILLGITTAALAVALIHATLVWHKAPDALVATSPPRLLLGDDTLAPPTPDFHLVSEGEFRVLLHPYLSGGGLTGAPVSLQWRPASFQSDSLRTLP
jgi:anti-sigma factor RsiW